MRSKEYTFKEGFTIKPRKVPDGVVFAMGEHHICEKAVFDLHERDNFVETYETFNEAKSAGLESFSFSKP